MDGTTELVVRAQDGDRAALDELLGSHLSLVHGVVARAMGDDGTCRADVEDVVQETMLRVVTSLGSLREPDRFRSWVVAVAYRQMQDHHRARRRRAVPQDPVVTAAIPDDAPDPADIASAGAVADDGRRGLALAARWLDPAHQAVLGLWWAEACGQLGRADLARALDVGRRHAAVRVQRMRGQLDVARGIVAALDAAPRCADLARTATGWDGTPSPLWRKRLDRHVRRCDTCLSASAALVPPERLVPALGLLPVPVALATSVRELSASPPVASGAPVGWWQGWVEPVRDGWEAIVARPAAAVTAVALTVGGGATVTTVVMSPERPPAVVVASTPSPDARDRPPETPSSEPSHEPVAPSPAEPVEPPPDGTTRGVVTADLYVAPDGSDAADGSWARPFATVAHAVEVVRPGQTVAVRGGTYVVDEPLRLTTDGAPGARIVLSGYRDELPVLDLGQVPADEWPIVQDADHWTVGSLEIRGSRSHGYVCLSCAASVFEHLDVHDNTRSGLELRGEGTRDNVVRDSAFHHNHDDSAGGSAGIGLGVKFGSGEGNVVMRNRFFENADDGVDLGDFGSAVTLRDNESYGNGFDRWGIAGWQGNGGGFTLGGGDDPPAVAHVLVGNVAWGNGHHGFTDGGNRGALLFAGNVARDNGGAGYFLADAAAVLDGDVATGNDVPAKLGDAVVGAVAAS
jgi:RNA polymerase sigma factor (sigma-70 family)